MCGILIAYQKSKTEYPDLERHVEALGLMNHRGPDSQTHYVDKGIFLGHVRLDIIDREGGVQPMKKRDNILVFNGEIYNYKEIRHELLRDDSNISFSTQSDTEVLLELLSRRGSMGINELNGDWAFGLYSKAEHKILVSRDRFGSKPLYRYEYNDWVYFSSEIKSILHVFRDRIEPDLNAIGEYIVNSYGAEFSNTWFKGVNRFPFASYEILYPTKSVTEFYWNYPKKKACTSVTLSDYEDMFKSAVNIRTRADFPVTIALSSGIDSMSIASVLVEDQNLTKAYTVGFSQEEFLNEDMSQYSSNRRTLDELSVVSRFTAEKNIELEVVGSNDFDYFKSLEACIYAMECGHTSPSVTFLNELFCRVKNEYRVVLDGQGADELLSGYTVSFFFPWFIHTLLRLRFRTLVQGTRHFCANYSLSLAVLKFLKYFDLFAKIKSSYYRNFGMLKSFGNRKNMSRIREFNYFGSWSRYVKSMHSSTLANLIHYGDAISMNNSIESRSPFLDFRLVELAMNFEVEQLFDGNVGKKIHRDMAIKELPDFVTRDSTKFGFNVPINDWFADTKSWGSVVLLSESLEQRNLFRKEDLERLLKNNVNGKNNRLLYRVLSVEIWFKKFMPEWRK